MLSKRYTIIINIIRTLLLLLLFILMDIRYLLKEELNNYCLSETIMNTGVGYNNLFLIGGLVITALYILGLNYYFKCLNYIYIIKLGKQKFYKKSILYAIIDAIFISLEYVGITVIVCTLAFDSSILYESGFYVCCIFYTLLLIMYFSIVGVTTATMRVIVNFKNLYLLISIIIFFILTGLYVFQIKLSPIYYCEFITDWFCGGEFDVLNYLMCVLKSSLMVIAIYLLGSMLIKGKDIIFDEKD